MIVKVDIENYSPEVGLRLKWDDGFEIQVGCNDSETIIQANESGLISLARHLLTLAQTAVPKGHHIHLDESNSLEDGSRALIIEKI